MWRTPSPTPPFHPATGTPNLPKNKRKTLPVGGRKPCGSLCAPAPSPAGNQKELDFFRWGFRRVPTLPVATAEFPGMQNGRGGLHATRTSNILRPAAFRQHNEKLWNDIQRHSFFRPRPCACLRLGAGFRKQWPMGNTIKYTGLGFKATQRKKGRMPVSQIWTELLANGCTKKEGLRSR